LGYVQRAMTPTRFVMIRKAAVLWALMAVAAGAETVPVERAVLGASSVALHVHPFLTEDEITTLRFVLTNEQALALFVPRKGGFAALAVSPDDGFIREGAPVKSAVAVGDLPDAGAAGAAALKACEATKKGAAACVIVLEIAPAS
jgi:hypothetical protein